MATAVVVRESAGVAASAPQPRWAATPIAERLAVIKRVRHLIAGRTAELTAAIPATLSRTPADTLSAEVFPLLAACRFLERDAAQILAPRRLGRRGLPFWLAGLRSTVERAPFGTILIIAPANYPLLLPGVQALQALAAGNAVAWKPGRDGEPVARLFARLIREAGLPAGLLRITDDSIQSATRALAEHPGKIVFTGSAAAGRHVLHAAAEQAIPVVAELSGCDAVIVLPSANLDRTLDALAFGMRLNGSATCMAPRRLILVGERVRSLTGQLSRRFAAMPGVPVDYATRSRLLELVEEARRSGATILGDPGATLLKPTLILNATPHMAVAQADLFAPVLTVLEAATPEEAIALTQASPLALTVSIFGDEPAALALSRHLTAGSILINDLIVPTADPRVPFGGRGASGFGVTRGAEGLLEMTTPRTLQVRRGDDRKPFQPTTPAHQAFFTGVLQAAYSGTLAERLAGMRQAAAAAPKLEKQQKEQS